MTYDELKNIITVYEGLFLGGRNLGQSAIAEWWRRFEYKTAADMKRALDSLAGSWEKVSGPNIAHIEKALKSSRPYERDAGPVRLPLAVWMAREAIESSDVLAFRAVVKGREYEGQLSRDKSLEYLGIGNSTAPESQHRRAGWTLHLAIDDGAMLLRAARTATVDWWMAKADYWDRIGPDPDALQASDDDVRPIGGFAKDVTEGMRL